MPKEEKLENESVNPTFSVSSLLGWFSSKNPFGNLFGSFFSDKVESDELWKKLFSKGNVKKIYFGKIRPKGGQGADRIQAKQFDLMIGAQASTIGMKCIISTYKFTPYLEQLKSKGRDRSPRVLAIPTLRDKIVLRILTDYIHDRFAKHVARDLPNAVIRKIKAQLNSVPSTTRYIRLDIQSFYDKINHDKLFFKLSAADEYRPFLSLIKKAVRNPTLPTNYSVSDRKNKKNEVGVPQGLSISNILAEIYLATFDAMIKKHCISYHRFVDDVFILCHEKKIEDIWQRVMFGLGEIGLEVNFKKSTPVNQARELNRGIEFLGYYFEGNKISVRNASCEKFLHSIIGKITKYKHGNILNQNATPARKKEAFLLDINERITGAIDDDRRYGWIFFFIEINDIALLHEIDRIILIKLDNLKDFTTDDKNQIKRVVRAYYEAKFSPKRGYIHNYNTYETISQKRDYLERSGHLPDDPKAAYTDEFIENLFNEVKGRNLLKLQRDAGIFS